MYLTRFLVLYVQAADVFSFGVLLWELYHCKTPYKQSTGGAFVPRRGFPFFSQKCPQLYSVLATACMGKDPGLRPTFAQVNAELFKVQQQQRALEATGGGSCSVSPAVVGVNGVLGHVPLLRLSDRGQAPGEAAAAAAAAGPGGSASGWSGSGGGGNQHQQQLSPQLMRQQKGGGGQSLSVQGSSGSSNLAAHGGQCRGVQQQQRQRIASQGRRSRSRGESASDAVLDMSHSLQQQQQRAGLMAAAAAAGGVAVANGATGASLLQQRQGEAVGCEVEEGGSGTEGGDQDGSLMGPLSKAVSRAGSVRSRAASAWSESKSAAVLGSAEEEEDECEEEEEDEGESEEEDRERESREYRRGHTNDTFDTSSDGVGYQVGYSSIDSEDGPIDGGSGSGSNNRIGWVQAEGV